MSNRTLLVAGVILVAASIIGPAVQGVIAGPLEPWPGHTFGGGHMDWWTGAPRSSSPIDGAQLPGVTSG